MDPMKYKFHKLTPTGRLAKWQIMLTEFDIVYVTRTAMKAQDLADHLAKNPVDDEYQPLSTYFLDEEVNSIEVIPEDSNAWKIFFDGVVNAKGVEISAILISPTGQHYPATARLCFFCTNNIAEYEACIMGMNMAVDLDVKELLIMGDFDLIIRQHVEDLSKWFKSVEFRYIPRFHNELVDTLATLVSMLPYRGNVHIDLLEIQIRQRHGYCNAIEIEPDGRPCTEAVIPAEVEILSLRIIVEAEIEDDEWFKTRLEQLTMIDEKRMAAVCHGQLYQQRMARAYNKKVRPRKFEVGQLVLRRILLHHEEAKGKFDLNWKVPYIIRKLLPKVALYLGDIEGNDPETAVNADAVKRYYV
ncbi:uncharacterized protein [Nicotiana tomentosiformis]|uniref:uncharacterized protein n=1 Tax=Nicotiana tomentosiformis TaxID=4098 RepID=UPI00388C4C63